MRIEPKNIMCAIDFSDSTAMVLQYGKSLAKEFESRITLCHVVSAAYMVSSHITPYVDYTGIEAERVNQAVLRLEKMAATFGSEYDIIVETGSPAETIAQIAKRQQADMVVAATYGGSGIKRYLVGSVTDRLVKILSCPLMVLHPTDKNRQEVLDGKINLNRILVGCDFSEDSKLAFDWALSLAQEFQTQLYLAHVIRPGEQQVKFSEIDYLKIRETDSTNWSHRDFPELNALSATEFKQRKERLKSRLEQQLMDLLPEEARHWCSPETVILEGPPYQELITYARKNEMDLIVVGVRGHTLLETFLVGSTADRVISRADCPVLAIRQQVLEKQATRKPLSSSAEQKMATAGSIMEKEVISVTPETRISDAVKLFLDHHINGVPVLDDEGRLKGILCQSDLIFAQKNISMPPVFSMLDSFIPLSSSRQLEHELKKIAAFTVAQAMVEDPLTVSPETPIAEVASLMVENRYHTLPVVENGKLVGIIGQEDILKQLI